MSDFAMLFAIAVAVIVILLDLWAILSVFRSNKNVNTKALWAIGISLLPVIGLIAWGIAGPRGVVEGPSSPEHSK
ncbi:PLD nuclease N-terminal domain-containing protein [Pseudomonas borbori]